MRKIGSYFLQGLLTLLPIIITLYVLIWFGRLAESMLGGILHKTLPDPYYIPGMGVVLGFLLILLLGALLHFWVFERAFTYIEGLLERIPLVKTIYNGIKDITSFFDKTKKKSFDKVVRLDFMGGQIKMLGLITREDLTGVPEGLAEPDSVAVYLPMSYQVGGYMIIVKKDMCKPIAMNVEEAMRFALTAGVSTELKRDENSA